MKKLILTTSALVFSVMMYAQPGKDAKPAKKTPTETAPIAPPSGDPPPRPIAAPAGDPPPRPIAPPAENPPPRPIAPPTQNPPPRPIAPPSENPPPRPHMGHNSGDHDHGKHKNKGKHLGHYKDKNHGNHDHDKHDKDKKDKKDKPERPDKDEAPKDKD